MLGKRWGKIMCIAHRDTLICNVVYCISNRPPEKVVPTGNEAQLLDDEDERLLVNGGVVDYDDTDFEPTFGH